MCVKRRYNMQRTIILSDNLPGIWEQKPVCSHNCFRRKKEKAETCIESPLNAPDIAKSLTYIISFNSLNTVYKIDSTISQVRKLKLRRREQFTLDDTSSEQQGQDSYWNTVNPKPIFTGFLLLLFSTSSILPNATPRIQRNRVFHFRVLLGIKKKLTAYVLRFLPSPPLGGADKKTWKLQGTLLDSSQGWAVAIQPTSRAAGCDMKGCSALIFKVQHLQRFFSCESRQSCNRDFSLPPSVERGPTSQSSGPLPGTQRGSSLCFTECHFFPERERSK